MRLVSIAALRLYMLVSLVLAATACGPLASAPPVPTAAPTQEREPTVAASPTQAPSPTTAPKPTVAPSPTAVPTPSAAPTPTPTSSSTASIDARQLVITLEDTGQGWMVADAHPQDPTYAPVLFEWKAPSSDQFSPEGFIRITAHASVFPDDSGVQQAARTPLPQGSSESSAPPVEADFYRVYHVPPDAQGVTGVRAEAGRGRAWLQATVYGKPQSEVKLFRAVELLKLMLSRVP